MSRFKDDPKYREYMTKYCKTHRRDKHAPYVKVLSVEAGKEHMHRALVMWKPETAERYEVLDYMDSHKTVRPAINDAQRLAKRLGVRFKRAS